MYTKYFGLKEKPFNLTPDPKYLYLGGNHRECYSKLMNSVAEQAGFVVFIGEVGTGKTTICRSFLNQLPESCEIAYIFNPNLDDLELLKSLNKELGVEHRYATKKALLDVLYNYLIEQKGADKQVILLIDEAQNLSPSVLEQIRLLSNLETETKKLIQIILVGQPELDRMLENESLRQLRQRVSIWCRLKPLDFGETGEYIKYRLNMAGGNHTEIFTPAAVKEIYTFSKGVPRLANLICDRSLLAAFSLGEARISQKLVRKCIRDITGRTVPAGWVTKAMSAFAAVVSAAAVWMIATSGILSGVFSAEAKAVIPKQVESLPPSANASANRVTLIDAKTEGAVANDRRPAGNVNAPSPSVQTESVKNYDRFFEPNSRSLAVNSILAAWGISRGVSPEEERLSIAELAETRSLECFTGRLQGAQLEALNYAAILEVDDGYGKTGYLPVTAKVGEQYRTGLTSSVSVDREWVAKHWNGNAFILWKDYAGGSKLMKHGDRGNQVKWLQASMLKLGYFESQNAVTGVFGNKTAKALFQFQADNQLPADKQAGALTKMFIIGLLPEYKIPRLS